MEISDDEFETKEHEIWTMGRTEPQHSNTFVHTVDACIPFCTNFYVVVQFFPWFQLSFPCFKLIIHYHALKKYRPKFATKLPILLYSILHDALCFPP